MEIKQIDMTPANAARLLEQNTINRKLSRIRATGLAAAIDRGEWQFDGSPVKICADGTVIDGQHRLRAIADAGVESVPLLLITGLPAAARKVTDSGKARTFADYMDIEGVPNSLTRAAAVRGLWNYVNGAVDYHGSWWDRPSPSIQQLWELYEKRLPELEEAVSHANRVIRVVHMARTVATVAWIVTGEIECTRCGPVIEDREEFYDQLTIQNTGPASDGAMAFIRLMNRRGAGGREDDHVGRRRYSQTEQLALLFKAWNAYREGKPVSILTFKRGGKYPEKFPVPH